MGSAREKSQPFGHILYLWNHFSKPKFVRDVSLPGPTPAGVFVITMSVHPHPLKCLSRSHQSQGGLTVIIPPPPVASQVSVIFSIYRVGHG